MKAIYRIAISICLIVCGLNAKSQLKEGNIMLGADIANLTLTQLTTAKNEGTRVGRELFSLEKRIHSVV